MQGVALVLPVARYVHVGAGNTSIAVEGAGIALTGWSVRETTGAATADVDIVDGGSAAGDIVASINLNAGQTVRDTVGAYPVRLASGLFLRINSGTVDATFWVVDL